MTLIAPRYAPVRPRSVFVSTRSVPAVGLNVGAAANVLLVEPATTRYLPPTYVTVDVVPPGMVQAAPVPCAV